MSADAARSPNPAPIVLAAAAFGLVAALALAWCMIALIENSEMKLSKSSRTQMLDFVRVKRSESSSRKDRKPERPEVNQVPEAPPTQAANDSQSGQQLSVNVASFGDVQTDLGLDASAGIGGGDGEYLPIVKVAPVYPRGALARRMNGECMVMYTVTTTGTVKDVVVIEDLCPEQIFRRPSVDAAKRFKYKPRVIDGVAVEVRGVRNMFYFDQDTSPAGGQR